MAKLRRYQKSEIKKLVIVILPSYIAIPKKKKKKKIVYGLKFLWYVHGKKVENMPRAL